MSVLVKVLIGLGGLMALLLIAAWVRVYCCSRCPECGHVPKETFLSLGLLPIGVVFGFIYLPGIGDLILFILLLVKPASIMGFARPCQDCGTHSTA